MKVIYHIWLFILFFTPWCGTFADSEYQYDSIKVKADVQQDGTIQVQEVISTNFFDQKHGIYRDIPLQYLVEGTPFYVEIANRYVSDAPYSLEDTEQRSSFKIGDPDQKVMGKQTYHLFYEIYGLIRNFADQGREELYWNILGNQFDTNIHHFDIEINLPKIYTGFTTGDFLIEADGISDRVEDFEGTIDRSKGDKIILTYDKVIPAGNGITLSVKFPVGYFDFDHERQEKLRGSTMKTGISISPESLQIIKNIFFWFVFGFLLFIRTKQGNLFIKKIRQKIDQKYIESLHLSDPIITQYQPPQGLTSAEVGLLYYGKCRETDTLSLLYQWAATGIITMEVDSQKTLLVKKKKELLTTKNFENKFFNDLFSGGSSKSFASVKYTSLHTDLLKQYGMDQGRFSGMTKRKGMFKWFLLGFVGICGFAFLAMYFKVKNIDVSGVDELFLYPVLVLFIFSFINLFIPSQRMQLTEKGEALLVQILGYREFLLTCDEKQLKTFLAYDPLYFDKILPYAIVFGIETKIINMINVIGLTEQSQWYHSVPSLSKLCSTTSSFGATGSHYSPSGGFSSGSSFGRHSSSGHSGGGGGGRSW